jgi:hypothetical protein
VSHGYVVPLIVVVVVVVVVVVYHRVTLIHRLK